MSRGLVRCHTAWQVSGVLSVCDAVGVCMCVWLCGAVCNTHSQVSACMAAVLLSFCPAVLLLPTVSSCQECARYIETFKAYENRPASSIMEHTDTGDTLFHALLFLCATPCFLFTHLSGAVDCPLSKPGAGAAPLARSHALSLPLCPLMCCCVSPHAPAADYMGRLSSVLTSIRGINRSDAYSLARHFGSLADVLQ